MKLHELKPIEGSIKSPKRVGRGGSRGKTCGRGHNGAKSRSGYSQKRGFEGGQNPLQRRIPKFGFSNYRFSKKYEVINLRNIEDISKRENFQKINPEVLKSIGYFLKNMPIKILAEGNVSTPICIQAHAISKKAKQKIELAGGSFEIL